MEALTARFEVAEETAAAAPPAAAATPVSGRIQNPPDVEDTLAEAAPEQPSSETPQFETEHAAQEAADDFESESPAESHQSTEESDGHESGSQHSESGSGEVSSKETSA